MHLSLPHLTYSGPPIDDPDILDRLPAPLATALRDLNGCCAWLGVLHIRGACATPNWHSLHNAIEGPDSFAHLYPDIGAEVVAFAEEAFGDQFLVSADGRIGRLSGETGELEWDVAESIDDWFAKLLADPSSILGYEPTQALQAIGAGQLEPGKLISVYPPFVVDSGDTPRTFKPVASLDRRGYLAGIAAAIRDLPDGASVEFKAGP